MNWIPVSERLPRPNLEVLVTCVPENKVVTKYVMTAYYDGVTGWSDTECVPLDCYNDVPMVIAWMPLPEPFNA
jgi:hypothetical protein